MFRLVLSGTEEQPVNPHGAADRGTATLRLNPGRCVPAPRALIIEIIRNPQKLYVNLHNATHRAGAMRAQLSNRL